MNGTIRVPAKGDPLRAEWAASVANAVNGLAPMGVAAGLVREGQAGVGTEPLPSNRRVRTKTTQIPRPFDIAESYPSQDSVFVRFANRYYTVGARTYLCFEESAYIQRNGVCALKITLGSDGPSAEIASFASINDMNAAAMGNSVYCVPLYIIDQDGGVVCDLRGIPTAMSWEYA